jgi:hypothetical protein
MWTSWLTTKAAALVVEEALKHRADGDAVHRINNILPEDKKTDYVLQARSQMGFVVVAIHTTVHVVCRVLFDLAEHPEYISILREEIKSVLGSRTIDCPNPEK